MVKIDFSNSETKTLNSNERKTPIMVSVIAGGLAGTSVDVALFPIDTVKTRLQSPSGFMNSGGFRRVYNGLGAAAAGSAPGAAFFFCVYDCLKPKLVERQRRFNMMPENPTLSHMIAASFGEASACLVRVPTEVIKQTMQTNSSLSLSSSFGDILSQRSVKTSLLDSVFGGLYRGYGITLMREVPFAFIQFPLYEKLKTEWENYCDVKIMPVQSAFCGSISGGIAAAITTPLDVIKTRLMLGKDADGFIYENAVDVARRSLKEEGLGVFFRGVNPRVMWISIGGFVFFGAYEGVRSIIMPLIT